MKTEKSSGALFQLIRRLHFYIGLFVGPFILIAALTGTLYVATPQIESYLYRETLQSVKQGEMRSLASQVEAAQHFVGETVKILAVRPAPTDTDTTRVYFADSQLKESESRSVFINPYTLAVQGDKTVYGTSGILPLRLWIDQFHRNLFLGDIGRIYSELAASWMWIAGIGGLVLWLRQKMPSIRPGTQNGYIQNKRQHGFIGVSILIGMIFFSATGLTWSKWAGENVASFRAYLGWQTPSLQTDLLKVSSVVDEHAEHHHSDVTQMKNPQPELWDLILDAARKANIDAAKLEIKPPKSHTKAWTVTEIDRTWPTQVDSVAIDPNHLSIVSRVNFNDYPLAAKLTRWGIDFHMGVLFGLPNQLLLIGFGLALSSMVCLGYRMWWLRRPKSTRTEPLETLTYCWSKCSWLQRCVIFCSFCGLGFAFPVMGVSLVGFVLIDVLRTRCSLHPST